MSTVAERIREAQENHQPRGGRRSIPLWDRGAFVAAMRTLDLTAAEVAPIFGVAPATISSWRRGGTRPMRRHAATMQEFLEEALRQEQGRMEATS